MELSTELSGALASLLQLSSKQQRLYVREFEAEMASLFQSAYAVGVNSGTDGVFHSLKVLGVCAGVKVAISANVWLSSITAIHELGATPQFVDVDSKTGQMDVLALEETLKQGASVVVITHMYGIVGDLAALVNLARKYGAGIIEDACQCFLVRVDASNLAGTRGDLGVFSFNSRKIAGAPGCGGLVVTNNDAYAAGLRKSTELNWEDALCKSQPRSPSRLSPLMIPFIKNSLSHVADSQSIGRGRLDAIKKLLWGSSDLYILESAKAQAEFSYVILVGLRATDLQKKFREKKLICRVFYPGSLILLDSIGNDFDLPVTRYILQNHVAIPVHFGIKGKAFERRLQVLIEDVK